jgi:hypothetical protein
MNILAVEIEIPYAVDVQTTDDTLAVDLSDGRTISVPLGWYPRLEYAISEERSKWRLIGKDQGIHWDDTDEDISVEGLLSGKRSGESQASFKRWILGRQAPQPAVHQTPNILAIYYTTGRRWLPFLCVPGMAQNW